MKNAKERTITDLLRLDDKVYVQLETEALQKQFQQAAAREGFTLNGHSPLVAEMSDVMVVSSKRSIRPISGWAEGMAYAHQKEFPPRIDYGRYTAGEPDFCLVLQTVTSLVPAPAPHYVRREIIWG